MLNETRKSNLQTVRKYCTSTKATKNYQTTTPFAHKILCLVSKGDRINVGTTLLNHPAPPPSSLSCNSQEHHCVCAFYTKMT